MKKIHFFGTDDNRSHRMYVEKIVTDLKDEKKRKGNEKSKIRQNDEVGQGWSANICLTLPLALACQKAKCSLHCKPSSSLSFRHTIYASDYEHDSLYIYVTLPTFLFPLTHSTLLLPSPSQPSNSSWNVTDKIGGGSTCYCKHFFISMAVGVGALYLYDKLTTLMMTSDHASVVSMNLFVALLCACIIIGHLLEENRWINESITALLIVTHSLSLSLLLAFSISRTWIWK